MSIDTRKDDIIALISKNGPMGVNAIQRELNIPLSTLQKYLHSQRYFKLNDNKKWDLPENVISEVKGTSLGLMTNVVENSILLLQSQLEEMVLTLNNALVPIDTLKRGINNIATPVAPTQSGHSTIDPRLIEVDANMSMLIKIFRDKKNNIPEEYRSVLFNYDHIGLILKDGQEYAKSFVEDEIYDLLTGKSTELSEETLTVLKENQRETKRT